MHPLDSITFLPLDRRSDASTLFWGSAETTSVAVIVAAGTLSLLSVLGVLTFMALSAMRGMKQEHTLSTAVLFVCLMVGDIFQSLATIMGAHWARAGPQVGDFCTVQGFVKQTGNVTIATWSFCIALHAFLTLFRRSKSTLTGLVLKLVLGWSFVCMIVFLGPTALQHSTDDPFYTNTGLWCWIAANYPAERLWLEYIWEYVSIALSFVMYAAVLLRVRGNLYQSSAGWRLRFVNKTEAWKLAASRDAVDVAAMRMVHALMWYPVVYFLVVLPISLVRLVQFMNQPVPLWADVLSALVFNTTGIVDAVLFTVLRRRAPDTAALPALDTKRERYDTKSGTALRVTPFLQRAPSSASAALSRSDSMGSNLSVGSTAPLWPSNHGSEVPA